MARSERALLVQVVYGKRDKGEAADSLLELERLADTAGAVVVGGITQRRDRPTGAFLIGDGKLEEVQMACREAKADLVIFDNDLSSVQVNNLDLALGIKVIDRTELILQIFAIRALSAESQIQVELAQLQYLISRIPASEKQQRFHGGIGMRGPGESPLQLRNAPMRKRIRDLKKKLEAIRERRERTRVRRPWPAVCLVGYTNAGKSTLLNALASADAYVDDRLFATLDTKTRLVKPAGGRAVLLTDTVGFIRHLPHGLIASFRSTLDVAADADLLLVVADAGHPRVADHLQVVKETLAEIGASNVPFLLVFNKCDLVPPPVLEFLKAEHPGAVAISALRKEGLAELKNVIAVRATFVRADARGAASAKDPEEKEGRKEGRPSGID
ncbi:MAG: GTPase HflX [Verrucomicrobiota bacterium]|nr:GTPase HflX [Verrucomicrobiota bacterium]